MGKVNIRRVMFVGARDGKPSYVPLRMLGLFATVRYFGRVVEDVGAKLPAFEGDALWLVSDLVPQCVDEGRNQIVS